MTTESKLLCSELHTREVEVPECVGGRPCRRVYHFYLPRILCHGGGGARRLNTKSSATGLATEKHHRQTQNDVGHYYQVGTLPLVFCLHGYESDAHSMMDFAALADTYHFVLVLPEGLENSFNAGDCCGYALENNVDDVGFLTQVQTSMATDFGFIQPNFSYGIGVNNGAFLLTFALENSSQRMFRSIVPISGYTHQVNLIKSQFDGSKGIGMMMHHSLEDTLVRPSGCCDNNDLPKCNGGVQSDYCMSVLHIYDLWSRQINKCSSDIEPDGDGFGRNITSSNGYSLSYESKSKSTMFSRTPDADDPGTIKSLYKSNLPLAVSYSSPDNSVTCLTTSSQSCVANSTLCLYTEKSEYHGKDVGNFDLNMFDEIMDFIAREACTSNGGMLLRKGGKTKHECVCPAHFKNEEASEKYGGTFCVDLLNENGEFKELPITVPPEVPRPELSIPVESGPNEYNGTFVPAVPGKPLSSHLKVEPVVDSKTSDLATSTEQGKHMQNVWIPLLLAVIAVFGVAFRRRRLRRKRCTNQQIDHDFGDPFRSGSPYRDYFQRGKSTSSGIPVDRDRYAPDSSPQQRHETELLHRHTEIGELDSSEWEEHCPPYRCAPTINADRRGRHFVSDNSFSDSYESDGNSPQQSNSAKSKSSASYLDTADRLLLRQFRQRSHNNVSDPSEPIRRRQSEEESESIRQSFSEPDGQSDALDNDLVQIEVGLHEVDKEII